MLLSGLEEIESPDGDVWGSIDLDIDLPEPEFLAWWRRLIEKGVPAWVIDEDYLIAPDAFPRD